MSNKLAFTSGGQYKVGDKAYFTTNGLFKKVKKAYLTVGGVHKIVYVVDDGGGDVPHTHVWGTPSYVWAEDCSSCTATVGCVNCSEVVKETSVNIKTNENPDGSGTYEHVATFADSRFASQHCPTWHSGGETDCSHDYATITYEWSCDSTTCTATAVCANCGDVVTEEAQVNTRCPEDSMAYEHYVEFSNVIFSTQTCGYLHEPEHTCEHEATTTVEPTCTDKGYTVYTCSCGDEYTDDYEDALGHEFTYDSTHSPSCEENGYDVYQCDRCGELEERNHVDALGHEWAYFIDEDATEYWKCDVCGAETTSNPE